MIELTVDEYALKEHFCLFCALDETAFWILWLVIVDVDNFEAFEQTFKKTFCLLKFFYFDYNFDSLAFFLMAAHIHFPKKHRMKLVLILVPTIIIQCQSLYFPLLIQLSFKILSPLKFRIRNIFEKSFNFFLFSFQNVESIEDNSFHFDELLGFMSAFVLFLMDFLC